MTHRSAVPLLILVAFLFGAALLGHAMWGHYRAVLHDFEPAPPSALLAHPEQTGIDRLTAVAFTAHDDNRIAGWYVPAKNRAAVIVTHGTNADRSSMLDEIRLLADAGFGVLAFDWPGDGESTGEVRWGAPEREALRGAIDWLAARSDVDPDRLGAFGFSMGGYFVTRIAAEDPRLRAVVIASGPPSYLAYVRRNHRQHGWLSRLPAEFAIRRVGMQHEAMPPIDCIAAIAPRPVLLLGGSEDRSIPPDMTRELFERAGEPKALWMIDGAAHGHYIGAAPDDYPRRIIDFYATHLADRSAGAGAR
ncbi:MAG TPA: alpha/beta fold hydrolase [Povalibacter sp.]|uniref:alpha/beta hydrolase n=1 Tax=Povalibacter sp. TaxID=1962978 RepID=UPI002CDE0AE2|nr:alpha/beta fold hydrolase [Povalibacter sp.]HMN45922.1 alpha/beta fold hydrolase [Povalibacter sp.]